MFTAKEQQYFNILNVLMMSSLILFTVPNFSFYPALISLVSLVFLNMRPAALPVKISGITVAILLYLILMMVNIVIVNPVFHVEGFYFICFIGLAFFFGNSLRSKEIIILRNIGLFCLTGILLLGYCQYLFQYPVFESSGSRVNGIFTTPNSFAAFINLFLVPLLILKIARNTIRIPEWLLFALFFILLSTQSRGGWLAAIIGMSFGVLLLIYRKQLIQLDKLFTLLLKLSLLIIVFIAVEESGIRGNTIRDDMFSLSSSQTEHVESAKGKSLSKGDTVSHRTFFYQIALNHFKEKPLLGHGYYNYKYYLLRNSDVNMRNFGNTHYTHNDYLQHLMETGIIGLASLLLILFATYRQLLHGWKNKEQLVFVVALAAGFTSYFAHAMVDFLFYLPGLTVIFFLLLGIFNRMTSSYDVALTTDTQKYSQPARVIMKISATIFILLLGTPFIAQACFQRAESLVEANEFIEAQKMYTYAQVIAPYNPGYYNAEAKLWHKALQLSPDIETFNKVDALLVEGIKANPYEPDNLMARSKLHRDVGMKLGVGTSWDEIISWQKRISEWRPNLNIAKKELVTTLQAAGRTDEAREVYAELQQEILGKREVQRFLKRILK